MELELGIFYLLIFFVQLILLVNAVRKPSQKRWTALFGLEIVSAVGAAGLMFLFDALPGGGTMPGITWFAEFFYSLFAAVGYIIMILLTAIMRGFKK